MSTNPVAGFFKPTGQREAKADMTTKAARQILDSEASARMAKTRRLRAARLAKEMERPSEPAKSAQPRKRAAGSSKA